MTKNTTQRTEEIYQIFVDNGFFDDKGKISILIREQVKNILQQVHIETKNDLNKNESR